MVPPNRQTLFFSATWPREVKAIASRFVQHETVHIFVGGVEEGLQANKAIRQHIMVGSLLLHMPGCFAGQMLQGLTHQHHQAILHHRYLAHDCLESVSSEGLHCLPAKLLSLSALLVCSRSGCSSCQHQVAQGGQATPRAGSLF